MFIHEKEEQTSEVTVSLDIDPADPDYELVSDEVPFYLGIFCHGRLSWLCDILNLEADLFFFHIEARPQRRQYSFLSELYLCIF